MANSGTHTRKRSSKLRWRGVLYDSKPMLRRLIALVLAVAFGLLGMYLFLAALNFIDPIIMGLM